MENELDKDEIRPISFLQVPPISFIQLIHQEEVGGGGGGIENIRDIRDKSLEFLHFLIDRLHSEDEIVQHLKFADMEKVGF